MIAIVLALTLNAADAPLNLTELTRPQLVTERAHLELTRPGVAGPVIAQSTGTVLMFSGMAALSMGLILRSDLGNVPQIMTQAGAAVALTGLVATGLGTWLLLRAFWGRTHLQDQLDAVDRELALRPQ